MQFIELKEGSKEPKKRHEYYSSCEELLSAGIALDNYPGVCFIDFDNLKENNGLEVRIIEGIKKHYPSTLVVKTTKGYHLYYKTDRKISCMTAGFTTSSFQCDLKIGKQYGVIKQNGVMREYEGELSFDNLNDLPDILLPIKGNDIENLCGLKEGDGRHSKLLRHLCQVRKNYDDVDIKKIGNFINEYIFNDSMDEKEMNNIITSVEDYDIEPFDSSEFLRGEKEPLKKFLIRISGLYVEKYDLKVAYNQIYYNKDGKYYSDVEELACLLYSDYQYAKNEYEEIIFQIKRIAPKYNDKDEIISINNGIIKNHEFIKDAREFSPYYIDVEYDENSYDENVDSFLQMITCNYDNKEKNELRLVIEEMLGHCLMTKNFPHKVFILLGTGANGKSTLMNSLYNLFGDLATNVPINKLDRDDYVARLTNKLVNISDDVDFSYIKSSQNVKTLASGDYIVGRELYQKAYNFKNKATLIFSLNEMVLFADHSYGLHRRLCIIPFLHNITNPNPKYLDLLTTNKAKNYWFKLAMDGMRRIIENGNAITKSQKIEDLVNNYIVDTDSVSNFLKAYGFEDLTDIPIGNLYANYCAYCLEDAGYDPYSKNKFSRILSSKGYTSVVKYYQGKRYRVIVKVDNIVKSSLQNKQATTTNFIFKKEEENE